MADDPLDILAWTMLGEAGGEGTQGMADVAHVALNRLNAGKYGGSLEAVLLAPKQFSTWNSGAGGNNPKGRFPKDSAEFQNARRVAEQVIAGTIPGPPGKPLDYVANGTKPYWGSSKDANGTYQRGGHTFYPSTPVPPGEIPQVATRTDTVPRQAPAPVTPSIDMRLMRGTMGNAAPNPAFGGDPLTPSNGPVVARIPTRAPSAFNGDPLTPSAGPVIASIPTAAKPPALPRGPMSYAGQDQSSSPVSPWQTIATIPTTKPAPIAQLPPLPGSPIGAAPATRTVQSVPMPPLPQQPRLTTGVQQSYAGQDRAPPTRTTQLPTQTQLAAATGFTTQPRLPSIPYASGTVGPKTSERLPTGLPADYNGTARTQMAALGVPPANLMAAPMPPMPFARPNPLQVATQLDTMPPMPQRRPVNSLAQMAMPAIPRQQPGQTARQAPIPASMSTELAMRRTPLTIPQGMTVTSGMLPAMHAQQVSRPPLEITVSGANIIQPQAQPAPPKVFESAGYLYQQTANGLQQIGRAPGNSGPYGKGGNENGAVQPKGTLNKR